MNSIELCVSIARTLPSLFECSPAPMEGVRVRTPRLYPDCGMVDVFVLERGDGHLLTDFGEALVWLRMRSLSTRRSPRQQYLIEDVCQTLGVELYHGELTLRVGAGDDMAEAVIRLAQAVVRVSDIWFTFRYRRTSQDSARSRSAAYSRSTSDEVEYWLREKRIHFERGVKQIGQSSRDWTIDYLVDSTERTSLVFLLSAASREDVTRVTDHVVSGCLDLNYLRNEQPHLSFVSLFDDTNTRNVWRDEDFTLVSRMSKVAYWSRPDEVERILTTL